MLKQICITGLQYSKYGLADRDVLAAILAHHYGKDADHVIDDVLWWSKKLSDDRRITRHSEKLNCWEANACKPIERNSRGEVALCPVLMEEKMHGPHGGIHAGRACWLVDGTMCKSRRQGSAHEKSAECAACGFYIRVHREEGKVPPRPN